MLECDGLDSIHVDRLGDQWSIHVNLKEFQNAGTLFSKFVIVSR